MITTMPASASASSTSPSSHQATSAVTTGAVVMAIMLRRGPMMVKARNRAESPIASTDDATEADPDLGHRLARSAGQIRPVRAKWARPSSSTAPGRRSRLTRVTPRRCPAAVKNTLVQAKMNAASSAASSP